jgi:hypothetical protein
VLAVLAGGAWLWLTAREEVPVETDYVLVLDELRRLGSAVPGEKPVAIYSELVAKTSFPRAAVFAGESFAPHPMVHQALQVSYPDGFVLLDAAFPEARLEAMGGGTYNPAAYVQVQTALAGARQIFFTHEHFDHLGGIATHRAPGELLGRLRLTPEQLGNAAVRSQGASPSSACTQRHQARAAEGVGPPGTLLAYVQLKTVCTNRPGTSPGTSTSSRATTAHASSDFFLGEDRRAVLAQFRALSELMRANPRLVVVVSRQEQRQALVESGS